MSSQLDPGVGDPAAATPSADDSEAFGAVLRPLAATDTAVRRRQMSALLRAVIADGMNQ